jgi:transcription elongation factor Elf1
MIQRYFEGKQNKCPSCNALGHAFCITDKKDLTASKFGIVKCLTCGHVWIENYKMKADDIYQYLFDLMRSYVGEVNGLPWEDNICEDCIHWNGSKCLHPNPTGSGDEGCDMYEDKKDDNTPMPGGPF